MIRLFDKKSVKSNYLRYVEYLQTCVKDVLGVGQSIVIAFTAPRDKCVIDYSAKTGEDLYLLQTN